MIKNILSISGGKDSTAMLLLAIEKETPNLSAIFCDTGNEHQSTYDYIEYLQKETGIEIKTLKADFSKEILAKRKFIANDVRTKRIYKTVPVEWDGSGKVTKQKKIGRGKKARWSNKAKTRALSVLYPTGNPFLDLCLWKGRFPSTKAAFCTEELKRKIALAHQLSEMEDGSTVISWQGIRRDESKRRSTYEMHDIEFGSWGEDHKKPEGHLIYRPIIEWTAIDAFNMHRKHGINWNPLYEQGMGRVGCMACINCRKKELAEIDKRFPKEIQRIDGWEVLVGKASKRGASTFFPSTIDPFNSEKDNTKVSRETHGIIKVVEWSKTTRGGRQFSLLDGLEDVSMCSSMYGLCE